MAQENVAKFEELLRSDEELQAKLRAAAAAYEGDKADEGAVFAATVAPLAEEAGLPFTFEELKSLAPDQKEIDDADLAAVAGGEGFGSGYCYVIGGTDGPEAADEYNEGMILCAYLGITIFSHDL